MSEVWSRPNRHVLREMRRKEHKERAAARSKLTTKQKLEALDRLLGKGVGAKKERAKLEARLAEEQSAKKADKVVKEVKDKKSKTKDSKKKKKS